MTNFEQLAQTYVDNVVKYLSEAPFEMPAAEAEQNLRITHRLLDAHMHIEIQDDDVYLLHRTGQTPTPIVPTQTRGKTYLHNEHRIKEAIRTGHDVFWRSPLSQVLLLAHGSFVVEIRVSEEKKISESLSTVINKMGLDGFYFLGETT